MVGDYRNGVIALRLDYGYQCLEHNGCAFSLISLPFIHVSCYNRYQIKAEYLSYSMVLFLKFSKKKR